MTGCSYIRRPLLYGQFYFRAFEKVYTMTQRGKVQYTGKTHTTGGRDGASRSSDGCLDIKLSSPGTSGIGTNPEQLFAAGWSACFEGAMGLAARKHRARRRSDADGGNTPNVPVFEGDPRQYQCRAQSRLTRLNMGRQCFGRPCSI